MKITRITRDRTTIYFQTESAGEKHRWRLNYFMNIRTFASVSSWVTQVLDGDDDETIPAPPRMMPDWAPTREELLPYVTDEDMAALLALSIEYAGEPQIMGVDLGAGSITIFKLNPRGKT